MTVGRAEADDKREAVAVHNNDTRGHMCVPIRLICKITANADPRASRSALTSGGAARVGRRCGPWGRSAVPRNRQVRFLKRQLSLPVSRISQW